MLLSTGPAMMSIGQWSTSPFIMLTGQLSPRLAIYWLQMLVSFTWFLRCLLVFHLLLLHLGQNSHLRKYQNEPRLKLRIWQHLLLAADPAHLFSARTHWAVITPITVWSLLSSQPPLVVWSLAAPVRRPVGVNYDASVREILKFQWWHFVLICKIGPLCFNILKEETSQKAQLTQTLHWMLLQNL